MYTRNFTQFPRKKVLVPLLTLLTSVLAMAQPRQSAVGQFTPGGYLDTVCDQYGHRYILGELSTDIHIRAASSGHEVAAMMAPTCSSGYFQLYCDAGSGMDGADALSIARRNVLCQVLSDVSAFINSPCSATGQKVNIWVRPSLTAGVSSGSPFYNIVSSSTASGIADNVAWLTLNSGIDAFANSTNPLVTTASSGAASSFFHGSIAFNFSSSVTWHTDVTMPTPSGKYDLYTIALREVLHVLGISSLIDYNGLPVTGTGYNYFSRYDTHLETAAGTRLITNLSPGSGCSMYDWIFNPTLGSASATLSPGGMVSCPSGYQTGLLADHTVCSHGVQYSGGWPLGIPVYTPECFERGLSLSHFEDECYVPAGFVLGGAGSSTNNQYFAASNGAVPGPYSATSNPGAMKRSPTPEERQVLCDLGYSVDASYGNPVNLNAMSYSGGTCGAPGVVGVNDGIGMGGAFIYATTVGTPLNINPATAPLLGNDIGVTGGSFKCLEVVSGSGTVSATTGSATTAIYFTPTTGTSGIQLLRYIPVSSSGGEGNITYVFVYVNGGDCASTACDLVTNGNFEDATTAAMGSYIGLHCWQYYAGTPDLWVSTGGAYYFPPSTAHPFDTVNNRHYTGMLAGWDASAGAYVVEGAQEQLASALVPGTSYVVSCWARHTMAASGPTHVQLAVTNGYPLPASALPLSGMPAGLTPLGTFTITQPDSAWHYYSTTVTYSGTPAGTLVVFPAPWMDGVMVPQYIAMDDISIVPATAVCTIHLADTLTGCMALDLDTMVGIPGGTFTWYYDSSGVVAISHEHVLDPQLAYNASIMQGNHGRISVCYDYTAAPGCARQVCKDLQIYYGGPITGTAFACVGTTATLGHGVAGGTWSSGNTAVATISASGVFTGIGAGTAGITYTFGSGCYVTRVVTVTTTLPAITLLGSATICAGSTRVMTNPIAGGAWSSSTPATATVTSGTVTAVAAGTATITYSFTSTCFATRAVTVAAAPATITPAAPAVCAGSTVTLASATPGGTWYSAPFTVATVSPTFGIVTGVAGGVATISYTVGGCSVTTALTVSPTPDTISGTFTLCAGNMVTLADATPGGSWSSTSVSIATISAGGVVTGIAPGTCLIDYTMPGGCLVLREITVNLTPAAITPASPAVCAGSTLTLANSTVGGSWTGGAAGFATINGATGVVTAVAAGVITFSYVMPSGCFATTLVTVHPGPAPILGPASSFVCIGGSITLTDATAGGTWTSGSPGIATVSAGGVVSGVAGGMATITYSTAGGCFVVRTVAANAPAVITGFNSVCAGSSTVLTPNFAGGQFLTTDPAVATVNSTSGTLSGVSAGTVVIDYSLGGCTTNTVVTVEPLPITGTTTVTVGSTITLGNASTGGTWAGSNPAIATVGSSTGIVTGAAPGTITVTYTTLTGCTSTVVITVKKNTGVTGVAAGKAEFTVLPNPTRGLFTLRYADGQTCDGVVEADVLNILGYVVLTVHGETTGGIWERSLVLPEQLPDGQYLVRVRSAWGNYVARLLLNR